MASMSPPTLRLLSFSFFLPFHSLAGDIATEFLSPTFILHTLTSSTIPVSSSRPPPSQSPSTTLTAQNLDTMSSSSTPALAPSFGQQILPIDVLIILSLPHDLLPSGELCLLNASNATLWSSFDYPTDTLLPNQLLPVSSPLTSATNENDLTLIDYSLLITSDDSVL
ncbi:hypothetical protein ZIOFF_069424 [Zingiber officinale]|uniref:Uncharacterized protein n=1 Tax=Zingiber officinale TaxID=94328 RepID=A0A8J5CDM5_ZINOF|nr:hypothetical protein ZIOFF_069424 [Zingiber officinale]